jgi:hypothetical protein
VKIKSLVATVCGAAILWLSSAPAFAWNEFGHMTVAYIAYKKLNDATKARVDKLLSLNPSYSHWLSQIPSDWPAQKRNAAVFMYASSWPDSIKGDHSYQSDGSQHGFRPEGPDAAQNIGYSDHYLHKYWHFVDQAFSYDHTVLPADIVPNALSELDIFEQTLSSDKDDALKSYDLVWTEHIVGDLHQPLHCVTRVSKDKPNGDSGGNDVLITGAGDSKNLHGLWDWILGKGGPHVIDEVIAFADPLPDAKARAAADIKPADWAREGFKLAKQKIYSGPIKKGLGPFAVTDKYLADAKKLATQQAELGGARLANLLNATLK